MPVWLTALLAALLPALIDGFLGRRLSPEEEARRDETNKDLGAANAANETLSTIGAIASERADLPDAPRSDVDLARRLRERAARDRAASGHNGAGGGNPGAS